MSANVITLVTPKVARDHIIDEALRRENLPRIIAGCMPGVKRVAGKLRGPEELALLRAAINGYLDCQIERSGGSA